MAVFDIDETVLAAKQWGDKVGANGEIPGALDFVKNLENQGYTIAYCTARPEENRQEVIAALSDYGFPHTQDLVYCLAKDGDNVPRYKKNTIKMLMDKGYDVEMFYDDQKINRSVVSNLGVPTVADLREVLTRRNPGSVGYINDKIDNQLVRNMARLKKKRVAAAPAAPIVDFAKINQNAANKDWQYPFAIVAEEWGTKVGDGTSGYSAKVRAANTPSSIPGGKTGIIRSKQTTSYKPSKTVTDEFGVKSNAFGPMAMGYNTYSYNDRFPGNLRMGHVMPFPISDRSSGYIGDRYPAVDFAKPPAYATALFSGAGYTFGIVYSYRYFGLYVMSLQAKLKKKTWYDAIEIAYQIGLISPWIKAKWEKAAEQMGRKSFSCIRLDYYAGGNTVQELKDVEEVWEFAGAKPIGSPYDYNNLPRYQSGKLISRVIWDKNEYDLKTTYEGMIQMAKAIVSGQTGGKTQREIRMEDFNQIRDMILRMLTGEAADFSSAYDARRTLDQNLQNIQFGPKLARLTAKSPSLAKDLQPILDAKETLYEDIGEANQTLVDEKTEKDRASRKVYDDIEQAARQVRMDAEEQAKNDYQEAFMEEMAEQRRIAQEKLKDQIAAFRAAQPASKSPDEGETGDE